MSTTAALAAQYRKALAIPPSAARTSARDMSAMARQLQDQGWPQATTDALILARQADQFTSGAFGPSLPAQPTPMDMPRAGMILPRRSAYPVGYNLPSPPGAYKLIDFSTLRSLARIYDVGRRCIELRKGEVSNMDWEVSFKDPDRAKAQKTQARARARSAANGRTVATQELSEDDVAILELTAYWDDPDPIRQLGFDGWTALLVENILVIDAPAIFAHPTWMPGRGRLGSDLYALEVLAGDTIKPLIDIRGAPPMPPNPAYQQFLWGIPRSELQQDLLDAATRPASAPPEGLAGEYQMPSGQPLGMPGTGAGAPQLYYPVYYPQDDSLYGFSNTEQIILTVNLALKRQQWWTSYFCYDADTEVLTREGWKRWPDVCGDEEFATRSAAGRFEWQEANERKVHEFDYDGELVRFASQSVDLLVTPNHRMLVRRPSWKGRGESRFHDWHIREASYFVDHPRAWFELPVTSTWQGDDSGTEAWAKFLGLFLAEGWVRHDRGWTLVAQAPNSKRLAEVRETLEATGFRWSYQTSNGRFTCYDRRLAGFMAEAVPSGCANKRIPPWAKEWSPRLLKALVDGMMLGDGTTTHDGQRRYVTTSRGLANDLQEVVQKAGKEAWIKAMPPSRLGTKPQWWVTIRTRPAHLVPRPLLVPYSGKVYCVSVPNGIIHVRRHGQACWSGNTDGTVPAGLLHLPEDWNPSDIREYEETWNALLSGEQAWKHRVKAIPGTTGFSQLKPMIGTDAGITAFDEWLARLTCVGYDVTPDELGLSPKGGLGGAGYSAAQENVTYRKSLKPLTNWLEKIARRVITRHFNRPDLVLRFMYEEAEDALRHAQEDDLLIKNGTKTQDECRQDRGLDPYEGGIGSKPMLVMRTGALLLRDVDAMSTSMVTPQAPGVPLQPPQADVLGQPKPGQPASGGRPGDAKPAQGDSPAAGDDSAPGRPPQGSKAALLLWQAQAIRRMRGGRRALEPPRGAAVPSELAVALRDRLAKAATPDDVRAAFADFLTAAA